MSLVAYYRVSTDRQGQSGLGLEAQRDTVARYAAQANDKIVAEYTEVESGRKNNRPELVRAIASAQSLGATLVVAKLDHFAPPP